MNHDERLEQELREAFRDDQVTRPESDFEDRIMTRLAAQGVTRKRRSPARVLSVYWLLAAVLTVIVLARVGWLELQWSVVSVVAVVIALVSIVAPLALLVRSIGMHFFDLLWSTVED